MSKDYTEVPHVQPVTIPGAPASDTPRTDAAYKEALDALNGDHSFALGWRKARRMRRGIGGCVLKHGIGVVYASCKIQNGLQSAHSACHTNC